LQRAVWFGAALGALAVSTALVLVRARPAASALPAAGSEAPPQPSASPAKPPASLAERASSDVGPFGLRVALDQALWASFETDVERDSVELELAGLKAEDWGGYAGMRVRLMTGWLRPYVGGGVPVFFFTDETTMDPAVALGVRVSGGIELRINSHVSLQGDVGIEHFFNVQDALVRGKRPEETVFVPTLGVIGRL